MKRVTFFGLGAMGREMALNLMRAGHRVTGFDPAPSAQEWFSAHRGRIEADGCRAVADAEVVVLMVVNADQAESVLDTPGLLAAVPEDAPIVLMATCPPQRVRELSRRVAGAGRVLIDAPVSGGTAGAKAASLTVMAAGPPTAMARVKPVLDAMGSRVLHVGEEPGLGAVLKTVNQLLCGVHIAVAAEAIALAERIGVSGDTVLDIMTDTSAASWMLRDRGPRMLQAEPEVTSAVDIFVKDLGIVLEAGRASQTALPLASLSHQLFLSVAGRGLGRSDDSQVIQAFRALQGRD